MSTGEMASYLDTEPMRKLCGSPFGSRQRGELPITSCPPSTAKRAMDRGVPQLLVRCGDSSDVLRGKYPY